MTIIGRLSHDFRSACRGLWRAKGFTVAAVLTLALGIAGTTVMFTSFQGVLLRPLPVREQERLIVAWKIVPTSGSIGPIDAVVDRLLVHLRRTTTSPLQ